MSLLICGTERRTRSSDKGDRGESDQQEISKTEEVVRYLIEVEEWRERKKKREKWDVC